MTRIICDNCQMPMDCVDIDYRGKFDVLTHYCEDCEKYKTQQIEYDKDGVIIRDEVVE